jgi:cytochrome c peroxidase
MRYHSALILTFLCPVFLLVLFSSFRKEESITKVELGKKLFFDPILSSDSSISCASCHKPEFYFADTVALSRGAGNGISRRNTPSVLNMDARELMFWDGRAATLEHQALFPVQDPNEMNLPVPEAINRLRRSTSYLKYFNEVFGKVPDEPSLRDCLAAFERNLETSGSRFDLAMNGKASLSVDEKAGQKLFVGKGKCFDCHFGQDFTGDEFRNIGLYDGKKWNDAGRYEVSKDSADLGKFKVPGLRNVAMTAPYMHNGSFKTLREVIDYYARPEDFVPDAIGTDTLILGGLKLSEKEKQQLEAFLRTLTSPPLTLR